jgi:hypothetical protein
MAVITIIVALVSLWALFQFAIRLWDGSLPWGAGRREPLRLSAILAFALGCLYLVSYHFEWVPRVFIDYGWSGLTTIPEYLEQSGVWLRGYVSQSYALGLLPLAPSYMGAILLALLGGSVLVRRARGKSRPGLIQDAFLGWFASLGLAPFAAVATGVFMAVVVIAGLAVVGGMMRFARTPVRR